MLNLYAKLDMSIKLSLQDVQHKLYELLRSPDYFIEMRNS
jgi:hypothetical protein